MSEQENNLKETENSQSFEENQENQELQNDHNQELDQELEEESSGAGDFINEHRFAFTLGIVLAGIAALLVVIIGLFSGVTFLTIIWRLFLSAIIFFIIGFAIGFLLKQFVPEIVEINPTGNTDDFMGDSVDYTVGEEDKEFLDGFQSEENVEIVTQKSDQLGGKAKEFKLPTDDPKILAEAVRTKLKEDE